VADRRDQLQRRLAEGDPAAYRTAFELYGGGLYRAALRMLGSSADAEDAVQDVFVAVVAGRARLTGVEDLKAYLFAALRHAAGRLGQRRDRQPAASLELQGPTAVSVAGAASAQMSDGFVEGYDKPKLTRAVARLPHEQRAVLAMKIDGELTFEQIGSALGISPNTAASRYRYALAKLRDLMGAAAGTPRASGGAGLRQVDAADQAGGRP
jgi:RNA polymerase sigma-70 factor (ECF subfamily)